MSQQTDPTTQAATQPTAPPPAYGQPTTPYDDPSSLHPHRRMLLMGIRAITYLVYAFVIAVEIILLLGFLLLLGGANASSSFVEWSYRNLDRVMEPFRGIFTPIELGSGGSNEVASVFDTSVLFAMIIYAIVGITVYSVAQWLTGRIHKIDMDERLYQDQMASERQAYLDRASAERVAATQAAATAQASAAQQPAPTATAEQPAQTSTDVPPPPA